MPPELLICLLGLIVVTYFMARPKPETKKEDNLIHEVKSGGLPPSYPSDAGGWTPPNN